LGVGGGCQPELGEDRGGALADRALAQEQLPGDGGVGQAFGHQGQY
jgi:hypothetical protein